MLNKIRSVLVISKIYIQRSMTYATIVNSFLIIFLFLSSLEKYGVNLSIEKWYPVIIIITPLLMILFGYLEDKLGVFKLEQNNITLRNPYIVEINDKLDDIKNQLDEMKVKND